LILLLLKIAVIYPAAEIPQLLLGFECFLPIAGCRVLERSLWLLPEGLHSFDPEDNIKPEKVNC